MLVSVGDSPRHDTRDLRNEPKKCTGLYYKRDIETSCDTVPMESFWPTLRSLWRYSLWQSGLAQQSPVTTTVSFLRHHRRRAVVADTDYIIYITRMHTHAHTLQRHVHAHTHTRMKRCLRTSWQKRVPCTLQKWSLFRLWALSQPVLVYFLSLKVYGSHFGWLERRVGRVWHANNKQMVPLHK